MCVKLTNISWLDLRFTPAGIGIPVSFFHRGGVDFKWNSPFNKHLHLLRVTQHPLMVIQHLMRITQHLIPRYLLLLLLFKKHLYLLRITRHPLMVIRHLLRVIGHLLLIPKHLLLLML